MMSEWPRKTIAECAAPEAYATQIGPFGKALVADEYVESGVPVLRGVNVNRGRFHDDDFAFIDDETADRLAKFESFPGDVLLVHKGPLGEIGLMPKDRQYPRYIMGNSMMRVRCDPERLLPEYLYYWLTSAEGQHYLFSRVSQVGVPQIQTPLTTLRQAELPVPPLSEKRAIADILGTLDDMIELNRRMSETLEAMARALFKSWFVDFDPVRAKMEGQARQDGARRGEPRKPSHVASDLLWPGAEAGVGAEGDPVLPKHIVDLFPARLVDSELGEIPEGREVALAGSVFDVAIGKTPPRKEHHWFSTDPQDVPWMSSKDLGQAGVFISEVTEYLTPDAVDRFRVRRISDGTVVLSFKLTVGRVAITDGEMLSNEAIAHFLPRGRAFLAAAHLYCYLRKFDYDSLGSTSSIATAVNSDSVTAIPVLVPSKEVHEALLRAISPSFSRLRALQRESRTLAALRNTLLPKLISGELRIGVA